MERFKWSILEVCCPGPGISQGDLAFPPASKDAESPSHPFLLSSTEFRGSGVNLGVESFYCKRFVRESLSENVPKNFQLCRWEAERRVKHAHMQTREQGPQLA
jgi:hypothetical protein